jgi:hypothetical protein
MRTIPTDPNDIILFATRWGQYPVTRRERHRLAILHGLAEAEARGIAYGDAEILPGGLRPDAGRSYSADHLFRLFGPDGQDRAAARPVSGLLPAMPRVASSGRAGS